jgi:hypothetical protein
MRKKHGFVVMVRFLKLSALMNGAQYAVSYAVSVRLTSNISKTGNTLWWWYIETYCQIEPFQVMRINQIRWSTKIGQSQFTNVLEGNKMLSGEHVNTKYLSTRNQY